MDSFISQVKGDKANKISSPHSLTVKMSLNKVKFQFNTNIIETLLWYFNSSVVSKKFG